MSFNEQQATLFQFNKTNFKKVSKELRDIKNEILEYDYEVALALYHYAKKNKIKKRDDLENKFEQNAQSRYISFENMPRSLKFKMEKYNDRFMNIVTELYSAKNNALRKPRKSSFKKLTSKDKDFNIEGSYESGFFVYSDKNAIVFSTDYNNHSVDDSFDHPFVAYLHKHLKNRTWGRNEGGWIIYHSENIHYDDFDVFDPYDDIISSTFGTIGKKKSEDIKKTLKFRAKHGF